MERKWFTEELSKAFQDWKSGMAKPEDVANLESAILFADRNGINLVLKVPRSVLDMTASTRPMLRQDALDYSSATEGDNFVFEIPAEINRTKVGYSKRLELKAIGEYRGFGPMLALKNRTGGAFGLFLPGEVTSLEIK